jgi:hypothetical protein
VCLVRIEYDYAVARLIRHEQQTPRGIKSKVSGEAAVEFQ